MKHTEIERKFLVSTGMNPDLTDREYMDITQGYLKSDDGYDIRMRQVIHMKYGGGSLGIENFLTLKSEGTLVREERETPILLSQFETLWKPFQRISLSKKRYLIPAANGIHTVHLDVYKGKNLGLLVAEVEFRTEEEAAGYRPESWFSVEITGHREYSNYNLAKFGRPAAADLLSLSIKQNYKNLGNDEYSH